MAHKRISGWFFNERLYLSAKIANELWYYGSELDDVKSIQKHLIFIGWYEHKITKTKLFTLNILFVSLQVGYKK